MRFLFPLLSVSFLFSFKTAHAQASVSAYMEFDLTAIDRRKEIAAKPWNEGE